MAGVCRVLYPDSMITIPTTSSCVTSNEWIWTEWNGQGTSTTVSPCVVWTAWNEDVTWTVSPGRTWTAWNEDNTTWVVSPDYRVEAIPESIEAIAKREEVRLAAIQREKALTAKRQAADSKAKQLLMNFLTEEQQAQYEKDRFFEVLTTRDGKVRKYRIEHGWAGNVYLIDDQGRKSERFCIHPAKVLPHADNLLAQKLLLESDEGRFLQIANKTVLIDQRRTA